MLVLRQTVALMPGETRTIRFTPDEFPQLRIEIRSCGGRGRWASRACTHSRSAFSVGDEVSDSEAIRFGIREMTSQLNEQGHRLFRVNGKTILIRGGGWAPDMLLRGSPARLETEFRYVREMNLNAIRLEGKMESDDFYALADEQGVLIMAGWSCCDHWEQWPHWKPADLAIASASLRSQIMRMRSHPSMLVWLNGSDNPPPAKVEKAYIKVLKQADWPNPYISSGVEEPTAVTEPSGVKMTGPYDYVPPDYWLVDAGRFGGAYGFNTEPHRARRFRHWAGSANVCLPNDIHPGDPVWNFHAGSEGIQGFEPLRGGDEGHLRRPARTR